MPDWSFADPPDVACFTSHEVLHGREVILCVIHYADDGAWQFFGSTVPSASDVKLVGLGEIVERDATVEELNDLLLGWMAKRVNAMLPWVRTAL